MNRSSPMLLAALFAAILATFGLAPARAAGIPAGAAVAIDAQARSKRRKSDITGTVSTGIMSGIAGTFTGRITIARRRSTTAAA